MEIYRTLKEINSKCSDFSDLPESFSETVKKEELNEYLSKEKQIEDKVVESFLNLIFDENEEDREKISTPHFKEKYTALLKIIEETNEEENDGLDPKEFTPKKKQNFEAGSPIIKNSLFNKIEDDISVDPNELFKGVNFMNLKEKNKYISIVRPSNNFNFGTLNEFEKTPEIKGFKPKQSPRNNNNGGGSAKKSNLPLMNLDYDKRIKNSNFDQLKHDIKNFSSKYPKHYTIKQKLQDVFFQLQKPNDISQYNVFPSKFGYKKVFPGTNSNQSPRRKEDYFNDLYKMMNGPQSKGGLKNMSSKLNKIIMREKDRGSAGKKINNNKIEMKLEGLNQMLNAKGVVGENRDKILNEDDFITLEERMKIFEMKKQKINKHYDNKEEEDLVNLAEDEEEKKGGTIEVNEDNGTS